MTAAVSQETRTCGRCGATLVLCPGVPGWWINANLVPERGACPDSDKGHQAWPAEALAAVRAAGRPVRPVPVTVPTAPGRKPAVHVQPPLFGTPIEAS